MMAKPLLFGLVGVLIFISVIVLRAPADPVWRLLAPQVKSALPGLLVSRVAGTVWEGQAQLQYANMLPGNLTWQLAPSGLLSGRLPFNASVTGDAHQLQMTGSVSLSQLHIEALTGTLDGRYLSQYGQRYQIQLAGELNILNLSFITTQHWPVAAAGEFTWSGGTVSIPGPEDRQYLQLPALRGQLAMLDQDLQLQLSDTGQELLTIILQPTGWAKVAIKTRMFKLANITLPGNQSPDDTALTLEEKIF
jgi:hypothetical protein